MSVLRYVRRYSGVNSKNKGEKMNNDEFHLSEKRDSHGLHILTVGDQIKIDYYQKGRDDQRKKDLVIGLSLLLSAAGVAASYGLGSLIAGIAAPIVGALAMVFFLNKLKPWY